MGLFDDLIKKFGISSSVIQKMLSLGEVGEVRRFLAPKVLDFILEKGLFLPGTLSNNFNPGRETIIKAITKNTHKVTKNIIDKL